MSRGKRGEENKVSVEKNLELGGSHVVVQFEIIIMN